MRRYWAILLVVVLLVIVGMLPRPVFAQEPAPVFGQPVRVADGETFRGDLVAFGGPVTVEGGGTVDGDVVAFGGPIDVAGRITGDVVALGGPVELRETARVEGDVVLMGGPLNRHSGAVVMGSVTHGFRFGDFPRFRVPLSPPGPSFTPEGLAPQGRSGIVSFLLALLGIAFRAAGLAAIALLVVIFIPDQTHRVKRLTVSQPIASIGVGLLTVLVAALLLGVLIITICGIPVAVVLGLALVVAVVYGWIALGLMVGEQLLAGLNTRRPLPMVAAVVGVILITLLSALPCLGWIVSFIGGAWGLGAVVLSRGGTRDYPAAPGVRRPPAPAPRPPVATAAAEPPPAAAAEPVTRAELDDLQVIRGIGPVYEGLLREAGIRTYADLAASSPSEVVAALDERDVIPVSEKTAQDWIDEAARLAGESDL
jgi:predicted flap endonuclease-1-like 5' DNA nuclease